MFRKGVPLLMIGFRIEHLLYTLYKIFQLVQMINELKMSSKISLLQLTKDYSSNASIHGVGYIFSGKTFLEKFAWFVCVISALAFATFFSIDLYIKWNENPVVTNLKANLVFC